MLILTNMNALSEAFSKEIPRIKQAVETLADTHNANILDIDEVHLQKTGEHITIPKYPDSSLTGMAKVIKDEMISRTDGALDTLIIVGDETIIPMWEIGLAQLRFHTDSFYADLDRDGLPEVAVTRILGNPEAMIQQMHDTAETAGPDATIMCSEDTRIHLETQQFMDALTQQGHQVDVIGRKKDGKLPNSDLIIHFGHGSPKGLSNRFGENFITAKSMPQLTRNPIAFINGCATTPPGSELLKAFLNNGCRTYLGNTATVPGMIPARYTNQLVMCFLNAYKANPDRSVVKLFTEARAGYAQINHLSKLLLKLEKKETLHQFRGDMRTHLLTFLEWNAYGSPFSRLHQGTGRSVFAKYPLIDHISDNGVYLKVPGQGEIESSFNIAQEDGQPILFLQADWLNSVSSSIELQIKQNGQTIHQLKGDTHIIFQHIENICVGGYVDGKMYRAYWLLPLERTEGENRLRIELTSKKTEIQILPESMIQIWPEWETTAVPQSE